MKQVFRIKEGATFSWLYKYYWTIWVDLRATIPNEYRTAQPCDSISPDINTSTHYLAQMPRLQKFCATLDRINSILA
jgi:hypothetical protein